MTLITTRQAADMLGVHPSTISRMVASGRLTPTTTLLGPRRIAMYLFDRDDVAWLRDHRDG